jgi:hypothetical protein
VLLLVLILILIAFGLLVVALLSGSVLWAWVSVAVSAVAALVLVVDYLQRRSVGRATADGAAPPLDRGIPEADRPEPEPATEILPVVRPSAAAPTGDPRGPGGDAGARFGPGDGGDRTVAVSQRQPPGSDERPPGAAAGGPPASGTASPTVIGTGVEASTTKVGPVGAGPVSNEATVAVQSRGGQPDGSGERPVDLGKAGPGGGAQTAARDQPRDQPLRDQPLRDQARRDQPQRSGPVDAPAAQGGIAPSDPTVHGVAPADVPASADESAAGEEPPEESREPTISAIVALLPDEVVVVDEQPRYHLGGCRALGSRSLIPLPVREAVELGFTPCGWCNPDRTLAERHPARAQ